MRPYARPLLIWIGIAAWMCIGIYLLFSQITCLCIYPKHSAALLATAFSAVLSTVLFLVAALMVAWKWMEQR